MVIAKWRKDLIRNQTIKDLEHNLKVGKMNKETERFVKLTIRQKRRKK